MAQSSKLMDTLLSSASVRALGELTGANNTQVQDALNVALPVLVDNMKKNASSFSGEMALSGAFSDHARDDTVDVAAYLKGADEEEGGKILTHVLGGEKYAVESDIAKKTGLTYDQSGKILAAIAPLALSVLGTIQKEKREEGGNSGVKDVLDSAMGVNGNGGREGSFGDRLRGGLGTLFGAVKKAASTETVEKKPPTATILKAEPSPAKKAPVKPPVIKATEAVKKVAVKKPAVKKAAVKKTAKKPLAKKPAAKKSTAKTTASKKPATEKVVAKKVVKKATAKKVIAKKVASKKVAKKTAAKRPAKKIASKKTSKKTATKKPAAVKTAKKAAAKKPTKKVAAKKTIKKATVKKPAPKRSVKKTSTMKTKKKASKKK